MVGINDSTGKWSDGFEHVIQSLGILFTTRIASRVMRRTFGSVVPALLGRSLTVPTILKFKTAIIVAIEFWEPRFRVDIISTPNADTPETLLKGQVHLTILGRYRPRGHLGDPTEETFDRRIIVGGQDGSTAAAS